MISAHAIMQKLERRQILGVSLFSGILLFALLQPLVHSRPIFETDLVNALNGPSFNAPFGTDHLGRSMLARIGSAIRLSMGLALVCVVSAAIPGIFLGVVAGWKGGVVDKSLSLLADATAALPGLLLILLISAMAPGSYLVLYLAISLILWLEYFRVVRAQTRVLSASSHIESSRMLGFSQWYCFWKHIWPGLLSSILPLAAFGAANAIIALATLGYINVGVRPPVAELGLMMTELFPYIYDAPFILMQPILIVFLMVLSLSLITGRRKA